MDNNTGMTSLNKTRSTEWMLSLLLLGWGAQIMLPNDTFDTPLYSFMKDMMRESSWGMLAVLVAALRFAMLGINGLWKRTPLFRALGSIAGGLFWGTLLICMYAGHAKHGGYLPVGVLAFYPIFFGFEGWCVAAAGYDMQKNGSLAYRGA